MCAGNCAVSIGSLCLLRFLGYNGSQNYPRKELVQLPKTSKPNFTNFEMCLDAVRRNRKAFPFSASLLFDSRIVGWISIVTILPLLEFATNSGNKSWLSEAVEPVFVWSGVDPSLEFVLVLLLSLLIGKAAVNAFGLSNCLCDLKKRSQTIEVCSLKG